MTASRPFDRERFAELRRARDLAWGEPLIYAPETGSTNDDALAAARSGGAGAIHGSVFLADHQTSGRGRRGKTWVAEPGRHLLFSIVLRDLGASVGVGALTLAVGLGVREALAGRASTPLLVKWPNDVLAGPRKLAGILCEGQFTGSRLAAVVIGIGINVLHGSYPAELEAQVACLEALATSPAPALEREAVLADVLATVHDRVQGYLDAGFNSLLHEFTRHDALAGARVEVSGATPIIGTARGVDASGRLLVDSDGLLVPVISGTVRQLAR